MKTNDRFLFGIVLGAVLLVAAAFLAAYLRPMPDYLPNDSPEGVTHNYLLALQKGDHERAYGYLSSHLPGYPSSVDEFSDEVGRYSWDFDGLSESTFEINPPKTTTNSSKVSVRWVRFIQDGLFGSREQASSFEVTLQRLEEGWKITRSNQFWVSCWSENKHCD